MNPPNEDPLLSVWPFPDWDFGRLRNITDLKDREEFVAWIKTDQEAASHPPIRVVGLPDEYNDWYWASDRMRFCLDRAFRDLPSKINRK